MALFTRQWEKYGRMFVRKCTAPSKTANAANTFQQIAVVTNHTVSLPYIFLNYQYLAGEKMNLPTYINFLISAHVFAIA